MVTGPERIPWECRYAHRGGKIAGETRAKIEAQTGRSIVTKDKASDYLPQADRMESLPEIDDEDDW